MAGASQITIQNNHIQNSVLRSAITIFKNCNDISIKNNEITVNQKAAFTITASATQFPQNIVIDSNLIYFNVIDVPCFQINGCDRISISGNNIISSSKPKILLQAKATRSITDIQFTSNKVGYFQNNFSFTSIKNNTINNFSARNNTFGNKSILIDEVMKAKMPNATLQNNQ